LYYQLLYFRIDLLHLQTATLASANLTCPCVATVVSQSTHQSFSP